jgi:hypothetical protein
LRLRRHEDPAEELERIGVVVDGGPMVRRYSRWAWRFHVQVVLLYSSPEVALPLSVVPSAPAIGTS